MSDTVERKSRGERKHASACRHVKSRGKSKGKAANNDRHVIRTSHTSMLNRTHASYVGVVDSGELSAFSKTHRQAWSDPSTVERRARGRVSLRRLLW